MIGIQKLVNEEYPPTHVFDVESLTPIGVLKDRVSIIEKVFPHFFMVIDYWI